MSDLPVPLTPADCNLQDFAFIPLDVQRLLKSETWVLGTGDERAAAMCLWLESWHQIPAASLPDNQRMLAHLAQTTKWPKVKAQALRGWVLCSDGRLYHPVVAVKALEAWVEKLLNSISGAAGNAKRWNVEVDVARMQEQFRIAIALLKAIAPESRALKKKAVMSIAAGSPPDSSNGSPPDSPPDRKGQGQGQGQGTTSVPNGTGGDAATPSDMTKAELWAAGKSLLSNGGMPEAQCGAFVGKLCKDYGDQIVIDAVRETVVKQAGDPASYLKSACQRLAGERPAKPPGKHAGFEKLNYREGVTADGSLA